MNTYQERDDFRSPNDWRNRAERAMHWLKRRPAESWMFFVAGLVLGALFL